MGIQIFAKKSIKTNSGLADFFKNAQNRAKICRFNQKLFYKTKFGQNCVINGIRWTLFENLIKNCQTSITK